MSVEDRPAPAGRPVRAAARRRPRGPGPAPDAARGHRVVAGTCWTRRPVGRCRGCRCSTTGSPRTRRPVLGHRPGPAGAAGGPRRPVPADRRRAGTGRHALPDAGDGPRVRTDAPGCVRRAGRRRAGAAALGLPLRPYPARRAERPGAVRGGGRARCRGDQPRRRAAPLAGRIRPGDRARRARRAGHLLVDPRRALPCPRVRRRGGGRRRRLDAAGRAGRTDRDRAGHAAAERADDVDHGRCRTAGRCSHGSVPRSGTRRSPRGSSSSGRPRRACSRAPDSLRRWPSTRSAGWRPRRCSSSRTRWRTTGTRSRRSRSSPARWS